MITAIVFISAAVDRIPEVAEQIAQLPGVSEVYSVTGEIDLIARDGESLVFVEVRMRSLPHRT